MLYITHRYPRAPLLGLGFSLGANVLTRYVAEEGEKCRLVSACALACVRLSSFNEVGSLRASLSHGISWQTQTRASVLTTLSAFQTPAHTHRSLHSSWFNRNIYAKGMGRNLRHLVLRHVDSIMKFPDSQLAQSLPELFSRKSLTLNQFDNLITAHAGGASPPFPFKNARLYYTYAASHQVIDDVRIPFLGINSDDDPIVQHVPIYKTDNEWVILVVTRGGGHLGWFGTNVTRRWMTQPALEWFRATVEVIDAPRRAARDIRIVDGWLVESGREHLGCKDLGEGGRIEGGVRQKGMLAGL